MSFWRPKRPAHKSERPNRCRFSNSFIAAVFAFSVGILVLMDLLAVSGSRVECVEILAFL